MNLMPIAATCFALLALAFIFLTFVSVAFGWRSGFVKLLKVYSWYGTTPPNTRCSYFAVGLVAARRARVGASEQGLYLHRGWFWTRSVRIPWSELSPAFALWPVVVLRERRTQALITVFRWHLTGHEPRAWLTTRAL